LTQTTTKYPLRVISPEVIFTEEQRSNIHLIASSRQGKSRFLEWLMLGDLHPKNRIGFCLIDPTAGGETAVRMLAHCAERNIQNVLYMYPAANFKAKKFVSFQPFKYDKDGRTYPHLKEVSINILMNAVRALYSVKDPSENSRIERYLPTVFGALYDAKRPLNDSRYLSNKLYEEQRENILLQTDDEGATELREVLTGPISLYNNYQSTVNRLVRFRQGVVRPMFSQMQGVNWLEVIRRKWVVIVNLNGLDFFARRLIGTYITSELESAKQRLNDAIDERREPQKRATYPPYYLYLDEAFIFASQSLQTWLDLNQKMNLKLTLAHHYAKQFEDQSVYNSILQNCDITAMFYTRSHQDRKIIAEQFYGGDIGFEEAAFATKKLSKQNAVIKVGKEDPAFTRIPDVENPKVSSAQLAEYVLELYKHPWYHDIPEETKHHEPRREERPHQRTAQPRAKTNRPTNSKARVPNREENSSKWEAVSEHLSGGKKHAGKNDKKEGA
jgi:hypothetical protein